MKKCADKHDRLEKLMKEIFEDDVITIESKKELDAADKEYTCVRNTLSSTESDEWEHKEKPDAISFKVSKTIDFTGFGLWSPKKEGGNLTGTIDVFKGNEKSNKNSLYMAIVSCQKDCNYKDG